MFGETIYLDNSAGTRLDERVLEAMQPYLLRHLCGGHFGVRLLHGDRGPGGARPGAGLSGGAAGRPGGGVHLHLGQHRVEQHGPQGRRAGARREEGQAPYHLAHRGLPRPQHCGRSGQAGVPCHPARSRRGRSRRPGGGGEGDLRRHHPGLHPACEPGDRDRAGPREHRRDLSGKGRSISHRRHPHVSPGCRWT